MVEFVFANLKNNIVNELNEYVPSLSIMFYSVIEKDILRIYKEYKDDKNRRNQMTEEDIKDEAELMNLMEEESAKDIDYLTNF